MTAAGRPSLSFGTPPRPDLVELAQLAQQLGYERVWLYDSPALYEDIYVWLDRVGQGTDRIGLGTAVLVPHLRHVVTQAAAIATIERLHPGRLACAFGTGATARWTMGKPALTWKYMQTYLTQLRGLLAGETVEVEGEACQLIQWPGWTADRPVDVPLLVSALGPRGQELARELGDGIMTMGTALQGWDWHVQMVNGTVLDEGEDPTAERVKQAAGPWYTVMYHGMYQAAPEAVDTLPGGPAWRSSVEAARPASERHLVVHEGHVTHVTDRDRPLLDDEASMHATFGWTAPAAQLGERAAQAAAAGVTELLYTPAGPDVARELEAFASALTG